MGNAERFSGKVALVTGGSSGIGVAVAAAVITMTKAIGKDVALA